MDSLKTCNVCSLSFDAKEHTPRLLPCGHTVCSSCLSSLISLPILRKCPFDNQPFPSYQTSLASFPTNVLVLEMLQQKNNNNNLCKTHFGELKYICLTENKKICSECTKQEEHKEHKIKKINDLKADGAKLKGELQHNLSKVKKIEVENENECEQIRKVFIKSIDDQFKEIKEILVEKQSKFIQQATKLFSFKKDLDSKNLLKLKQEMDETIKNINQTSNEDGGDMILLDKAIQNGEKMRPQGLKEKYLEVHNKFFEMQNDLSISLKIFKNEINSLELSNQEVVKEMCCETEEQQLSEEALEEMQKKLKSVGFKSHFDMTNHENYLKISTTKGSELKEVEINLDDFKEQQKVVLKLTRYDTLQIELNQNILSYMFRRLENLSALEVIFNAKDLTNSALMWVGNFIQNHFRGLKSLYLRFEECKLSLNFMQNLCAQVISKAPNLELIGFNFNSCPIGDKDLETLVDSLYFSQKDLEIFTIKLDKTNVTDSGVLELLRMIQSKVNLSTLFLSLKETKITDQSLEMLGGLLPNLKRLSSLRFYIDSNRFSEKGIWSLFKNLTTNLTKLDLDFASISISNELMNSLLEEVIPKLKSLELFNFTAQNRKIKEANFVKIHELVNLLNPFQGAPMQVEDDQILCKEQITQC